MSLKMAAYNLMILLNLIAPKSPYRQRQIFSLFCFALSEVESARFITHKQNIHLTSLRRTISWTTLMILAIVASVPPSPCDGLANSIDLPFRSNPRDNKRLLIYSDAVCKFWESIVLSRSFRWRCLEYYSPQMFGSGQSKQSQRDSCLIG